MSIVSSFRRPAPVAFLFAVVASALCTPASAQEAWCIANPSNCVMSESFQSTSYTRTLFGSNYALFTGDQSGSKIGLMNDNPIVGEASISILDGGSNTFSGNFIISTDSSLLGLLPNRNPALVARFLRTYDGAKNSPRFGYSPIPLGSTVKRFALRWYAYHSSNYQWNGDGTCTNGKIAHISQENWGVDPFLTLTNNSSGSNGTAAYTFRDPDWVWPGHSNFDGFFGAPRPGAGFTPSDQRGKWYRHEIVVRRPRNADSQAGGLGFDFSYFVKNVTDNTAEIEDMRFSSGCSGCMAEGGPNFSWSTGVYPTQDINSIHTEFYRAGVCNGWQGWIYAAVAKWNTDTGLERIGPAIEVEGGLLAPSNLRVQ